MFVVAFKNVVLSVALFVTASEGLSAQEKPTLDQSSDGKNKTEIVLVNKIPAVELNPNLPLGIEIDLKKDVDEVQRTELETSQLLIKEMAALGVALIPDGDSMLAEFFSRLMSGIMASWDVIQAVSEDLIEMIQTMVQFVTRR